MILVGHNSLHWVKNWSGQLKLLKTLFDSGASCKSEQKISSCNRFEVLEISFNSFFAKDATWIESKDIMMVTIYMSF